MSVTNTGVGIPDDKMKPLFQIDQSHSTKGTNNEKGTGLGLILCKEFIELYEGRIWAEGKGIDESACGTTFSFALPRERL